MYSMNSQQPLTNESIINNYESKFNASPDSKVYIAAKFITNFTKYDRAEMYQEHQNLGWPKKVVRAAAQMESAIQ